MSAIKEAQSACQKQHMEFSLEPKTALDFRIPLILKESWLGSSLMTCTS